MPHRGLAGGLDVGCGQEEGSRRHLQPEQLEGGSCHLTLGRLWMQQGLVWRLSDFEQIRFAAPAGHPGGKAEQELPVRLEAGEASG